MSELRKEKFEAGDRVIVLNNYDAAKKGLVGVVLGFVNERCLVQFDNWTDGHMGNWPDKPYGAKDSCQWVPNNREYLAPADPYGAEIKEKIMIAGYKVENVTKDSVDIGCKRVRWEDIDRLLEIRPKE